MSSRICVLLLQRDLFEPAIAQEQHAPYPREQRRAMGHDDAGDGKCGDEIGDALFCARAPAEAWCGAERHRCQAK